MKKLSLYCLGVVIFLGGCNKSPFERTEDPSNGGAVNAFGSGNFVIFSSELKSGGGAFLYPGAENQTLSFSDRSNPVSARSIRYSWNGQDVSSSNGLEHTFAGFDLMHTAQFSDYATTPGRDLRQAGYRRVTFYARGSLTTNNVVKVEVADPSTPSPCMVLSANGTDDDSDVTTAATCTNTAQLTSDWRSYSITVSNTALAGIKDYFKATFVYKVPFVGSTAAGQGGIVYFDQIQYEP